MGLFGIGGSSSRSQQSSSSSSFDFLDAASVGGSESAQRIAFQDVFANLFGNASQAAGAVDTGGLTRNANLLFGAGGGFLEQLSGGGAGSEFLEQQLAGSGDLVDQQIGQLGGDLSKFLGEEILPQIKASGVSAGTLGGGRGEVSKGIASEGLLREFARGATDIRGREQQRLTGIAQGLSQDQIARTTAGLGALPGLFGLAESGAMAGLSPFAALSGILGGPTTLQDSSSFDASTQTGRAGSQSRSQGSSRSNSFNFGFG